MTLQHSLYFRVTNYVSNIKNFFLITEKMVIFKKFSSLQQVTSVFSVVDLYLLRYHQIFIDAKKG